nr:MAG TPA: hypothetical protein [Caudoviricetes sp.]
MTQNYIPRMPWNPGPIVRCAKNTRDCATLRRNVSSDCQKTRSVAQVTSTKNLPEAFPPSRQCAETGKLWNKPLQMSRVLSAPRGPPWAVPARNLPKK